MKTPDKLYLGRRSYGPLIGGWQTNPFESKEIESIAYIRKDALMEWAKEMKEQVSIGLNAYDMGLENGKAEILNKLIDKLNSL